jgi:hypothetical protein
MSKPDRNRCRGCGKLLKFIRTPAGKWEPCNPELVRPDGKQMLVFNDGTVGKTHPRIQFGFISHFATCPRAELFKRKKPKTTKKAASVAGRLFDKRRWR